MLLGELSVSTYNTSNGEVGCAMDPRLAEYLAQFTKVGPEIETNFRRVEEVLSLNLADQVFLEAALLLRGVE
jgi:hypothetical protein